MDFPVEYLLTILWLPAFIVGTIFYHKKVKAHFRYYQSIDSGFGGFKSFDDYFSSFVKNGQREHFREVIYICTPVFFRDKLGEATSDNAEIKKLAKRVITFNWITIACLAIFFAGIYQQAIK